MVIGWLLWQTGNAQWQYLWFVFGIVGGLGQCLICRNAEIQVKNITSEMVGDIWISFAVCCICTFIIATLSQCIRLWMGLDGAETVLPIAPMILMMEALCATIMGLVLRNAWITISPNFDAQGDKNPCILCYVTTKSCNFTAEEACGNPARENPNGERLAETPQGRIQTENGLRKLRKGESKRRTACGNSARMNQDREWLAETPQRGIRMENGLRKPRKDESRRRTTCGNSATRNQSGERLAETPQG